MVNNVENQYLNLIWGHTRNIINLQRTATNSISFIIILKMI